MSKTKRYEFTGETIQYHGKTLHQIRALVNINLLTDAGDLGGYIESEANLPQDGTGWVGGTAKVFDNAVVLAGTVAGDAKVYGNAVMRGKYIGDKAHVFGNAKITAHSQIYGRAKVYGDAYTLGTAQVFDRAEVFGNAKVGKNAHVYEFAKVSGHADVLGTARIHGSSIVTDNAVVHGDSDVAGSVRIDGYVSVCFEVSSPEDFVVYKNILRNEEYITSSTKKDVWSIGRISKKASEIEKYFSHRNEKEQKYIMKVVGTHKKMFRL